MLRLLVSTSALALLSTVAVAADLPAYEPPPAMVSPVPMAQNWTGFYIGLHGGYGWADLKDNGRRRNKDDFNFDNADVQGPVIGGQLGVNWQWDWFVLGAEADGGWAGIDVDDNTFGKGGRRGNADVGFDWLASARLRAGLAWDRFMVYGTGGVGFGGADWDINRKNNRRNSDDSETLVGWVAGGGGEFMLTQNVTLGAEYLHYEFDDSFDDNNRRFKHNADSDVDVIRGRLNYKF